MVLAERNSELVRNGRRSRGPSPNGANGQGVSSGGVGTVGGTGGTPETSSDDDNSIKRNGKSKTKQSEYEEKIRVGRDYQAVCPPLIPETDRKPEILNDRALLVWSPTKEIPDSKLEEYITVAKEKYGYNGEQALGMLFWHKHDLERAVMDLANFTPFPDEWTVEDKVLFEQAFQFHGKSFHRIRQMLPDKSIASLVKYYYSWKKTRHRQSVMDRQEKAKASKEGSENGSENGSNEDSDNDDKDRAMATTSGLQDQVNTKLVGGIGSDFLNKQNKIHENITTDAEGEVAVNVPNLSSATVSQPQRQQTPPNSNTDSSCTGGRNTPLNVGYCANCGVACNALLLASPHGKFCASCHHHWRRTGNKRPTTGPFIGKRSRDRNAERKRKPPRGMVINHDDIVTLASGNNNEDELLANIDREIVTLLNQVQLNKQTITALKRKATDTIEELPVIDGANRINSRWTNDEILLLVEAVRKYGKDFQIIAELIGSKTEGHVRTFYVSNRRRYNLDQVLKQFEADKEAAATASATTEIITKDVKKKESTGDESDNALLAETTATKFNTDDIKVTCGSSAIQKDELVEIDLDIEQALDTPPNSKKIALSLNNQDCSKMSAI